VTLTVVGAASEAGSARALIPILARLARQEGTGVRVIASFSRGAESVSRIASPRLPFDVVAADEAERQLGEHGQAAVVTGTTIGPGIEKRLAAAARARGLPVIAVLDSWCNYRERFEMGTSGWASELPDMILIMDAVAETEAVAAGLPAERLRITGQPAFDAIVARAKSTTARRPVSPPRRILFLSEPLQLFQSRGFGSGFTEVDAFAILCEAWRSLPEASRPDVVIRPHPLESMSEWEGRVRASGIAATLNAGGELLDVFETVDAVLGISTIGLVEAFVFGLPVAVLQVRDHPADTLVLSRHGIVPRVSTAEDLSNALRDGFPAAAARRAGELLRWMDGHAADRACDAVLQLASTAA
jgi:hypothetical protein